MAPSKKSAIAAAQREFVLDSLNNTIPLTIEEIREKHPLLSDSEVDNIMTELKDNGKVLAVEVYVRKNTRLSKGAQVKAVKAQIKKTRAANSKKKAGGKKEKKSMV